MHTKHLLTQILLTQIWPYFFLEFCFELQISVLKIMVKDIRAKKSGPDFSEKPKQ